MSESFSLEWEVELFLLYFPILNYTGNKIFQCQQLLTQLRDIATGFKVLQMDALLYSRHSGNLLELFFSGVLGRGVNFGVCLFFFSSLISLFYKILHHSTTESLKIARGMSTSKMLTSMANSFIKQRL